MKKLWQQFISLGLKEGQSFALQSRIRLLNRFSLIQLLLSIFLIIAFALLAHIELHLFIFLFLISLSLPLLNYFGFHQLGRMMMSVLPAFFVFLYDINAKLANPNTQEILSFVSPKFVVLSSICIPLVLFTSKERLWLLLSMIAIILSTFYFDSIYAFFGASPQQLGLHSRVYNLVFINLIVVLVIILSTYNFLINNNLKNEGLNQLAQAELAQKNEALAQREQEMIQQMAELKKLQALEQEQNWVNQASLECAQILQMSKSNQEITHLYLRKICRELQIPQALIYLLGSSDQLDLASSYGIPELGAIPPVVVKGEGLIGQCFLKKEVQQIHELPPDFPRIQVGMEEVKARFLLLMPLIFNQSIQGVIEILDFKALESHQIDFLERVSTSFAAYHLNTFLAQNKSI